MTDNHSRYFFGISLIVGMGGVLYGYDIGVISGALLLIRDSITMTDSQMGWLVGAVLWGGLLGTMMAGPIADAWGRRAGIISACCVFIIGVICILSADQFLELLVARLLLGIGVGIIAVAVPLYVTEIVTADHRGMYVSFFQCFLTIGILLAYVVDYYFLTQGHWRLMFAVILIPAGFLGCAMCFLPESPRWLLLKGFNHRAEQVLLRLFSNVDAVTQTRIAIMDSPTLTGQGWSSFFNPACLWPLLLGIAVAILNQWTGVNAFLQYAPYLLKTAGASTNQVAMLGSVGIGVLNCVGTFVGLLLVDSWGRRRLLLTGIAGVFFFELSLSLLPIFSLSPHVYGLCSMIGLLGFMLSFSIGPGLVVWLVFAELLPTTLRAKGMAVCLFFSSCSGAALASFFPVLLHHFGIAHTYGLFAISALIYWLVCFWGMPEAKGQSLEAIQACYETSSELHEHTSVC
ncbi:MAG TPA: sugar porter family MFS transporter [Coxiellaceae bacterium]|nr:sugar porter family MFS transporter [Coxiellaceae bacterium]